jgi:hypothetical protein
MNTHKSVRIEAEDAFADPLRKNRSGESAQFVLWEAPQWSTPLVVNWKQ